MTEEFACSPNTTEIMDDGAALVPSISWLCKSWSVTTIGHGRACASNGYVVVVPMGSSRTSIASVSNRLSPHMTRDMTVAMKP